MNQLIHLFKTGLNVFLDCININNELDIHESNDEWKRNQVIKFISLLGLFIKDPLGKAAFYRNVLVIF